MRKFKIWWKAKMLDYPYWRVLYKDGRTTRLLRFIEARSVAETFDGKLYIDYNLK